MANQNISSNGGILAGLLRQYAAMPAASIAHRVNDVLSTNNTVVVTAPPGAGKSTLLPLTMLSGLDGCGKILMLEPRRLAARQVACRIAEMLHEPVGRTVGFRVRFESCTSADTRIEVLTEGILTRMIVDDATLDGVDIVVFDEFHERSINSDLALALARQTQRLIRPDLKIVVMSATIDAVDTCNALGAPAIESAGRMFDVKTVYAEPQQQNEDIAHAVAVAISRAHAEHEGDILAFLPGQGEIERCAQLLADSLSPTTVMPLYGNLPPERQRQAIMPSRQGSRKVVLATPVAETSLTIEGVRVVVDSGLCRKPVFDPRTSLSSLTTVGISRDMAAQRRGRAGRVADGFCYRLWTLATEHRMAEKRVPEILEADLAPMLLDILAFGESDIYALPWLTPPPNANVQKARNLLVSLGAVATDGCITAFGKRLAAMPCHPRIARMILEADDDALKCLACDIAALVEEKDPMADSNDSAMLLRISSLRACRMRHSLGRWARIEQIAHDYRRMAHVSVDNGAVSPYDIGMLVACAWPERVAQASDTAGLYRLSGGGDVRVTPGDTASAYQWIAVASLNMSANGGRVFLSAPIDIGAVVESGSPIVGEFDNVSWDNKAGRVIQRHEWRIGRLVADSKPMQNADRNQVAAIVCDAVKKNGAGLLDWNDAVERLQCRVATVAVWHPELEIPDLSTPALLATADSWLPFYLENNGRMATDTQALKKIDMEKVVWALVPYDLQQTINRLAPTHIKVPTGSNIRIDYRKGASTPVVSVRLQECFGMEQTPSVDDGRCRLLLELLSPGFKPVQLTQDLESFWHSTYFEVRKELKRRYPKHYWPENPLEAEAVRGTRRNMHGKE